MLEIVRTVVAFTNTEGGHIYIGIDDDCQIIGIDQKLSEWGEAKADATLVQRYAGAMRSAIIDNVEGEIEIVVAPVETSTGFVIVIEVNQGINRPVNVKGNDLLYVRRGASNRKLIPSMWPEVFRVKENGNFDEWMTEHSDTQPHKAIG